MGKGGGKKSMAAFEFDNWNEKSAAVTTARAGARQLASEVTRVTLDNGADTCTSK